MGKSTFHSRLALLPLRALLRTLQVMDRFQTRDLIHDTDIQSAGISLFYAGYMLTQLPGSLILSKYKPRLIIPLMM